MKLSDLHTGQIAVIAKVGGHGGFRKRIVEMGFIKGKKIKVVLNAPLRDPIEYELMGYKISLRREEAALVEVVGEDDVEQQLNLESDEHLSALTPSEQDQSELVQRMQQMADLQGNTLRVALVGNPNCGKTSLFNVASGSKEHVGNYAGVTIDAKEGKFQFVREATGERYTIVLVDMVVLWTMNELHHIGILLYGTRFAEVRQLRTFRVETFRVAVATALDRTIELRECKNRNIKLFGKSLKRA